MLTFPLVGFLVLQLNIKLTLPQAMASAGIIPGIITCVFSGSVAAFGLYLLSVCASRTPHRRSSFFAVAQLTYPNAAIFFDAAIAIKCFGVSIRSVSPPTPPFMLAHARSYLIIIKKLMPQVVQSLYHDLTSEETNPPDWLLSEHNWLTMFMLILVPLAFLRRIHSLRHTSYIALVSIGSCSFSQCNLSDSQQSILWLSLYDVTSSLSKACQNAAKFTTFILLLTLSRLFLCKSLHSPVLRMYVGVCRSFGSLISSRSLRYTTN